MLIVKSYTAFGSLDQDLSGKFVILTYKDQTHLVLSPIEETAFHANIVHRYLTGEFNAEVELLSGAQARIKTKGWSVKGGGYYQLKTEAKTLFIYGKSTAFGTYHAPLLRDYVDEIPSKLGLEGFRLDMV